MREFLTSLDANNVTNHKIKEMKNYL